MDSQEASVLDGDDEGLELGTRILVPQALQRTVFPRASSGIDNTFRHVRLGHIIRTILGSAITVSS